MPAELIGRNLTNINEVIIRMGNADVNKRVCCTNSFKLLREPEIKLFMAMAVEIPEI